MSGNKSNTYHIPMPIPGSQVSGSVAATNGATIEVVKEKPREFFCRVDSPEVTGVNVHFSKELVYSKLAKKQIATELIPPKTSEVCYLPRSFKEKICLQCNTDKGSFRIDLPVSLLDPVPYNAKECPAPISFATKPANDPVIINTREKRRGKLAPVLNKNGSRIEGNYWVYVDELDGEGTIILRDSSGNDAGYRMNQSGVYIPPPGEFPDLVPAEGRPGWSRHRDQTLKEKSAQLREYLEKLSEERKRERHIWHQNRLADMADAFAKSGETTGIIVEVSQDVANSFFTTAGRINEQHIVNSKLDTIFLGMAGQYVDKRKLFADLWGVEFSIVKRNIPSLGEKFFIVFSGNERLRKVVTECSYQIGTRTVVSPITVGLGSWGDMAKSAGRNVADSLKPWKSSGVFLILALGFEVNDWLHTPNRDSKELLAGLVNVVLCNSAAIIAIEIVMAILISIFAIKSCAVLIVGGVFLTVILGVKMEEIFEKLDTKGYLIKFFSEACDLYNVNSEKKPVDWQPFKLQE